MPAARLNRKLSAGTSSEYGDAKSRLFLEEIIISRVSMNTLSTQFNLTLYSDMSESALVAEPESELTYGDDKDY